VPRTEAGRSPARPAVTGEPAAAPPPFVPVDPTGVYFADAFERLFRLKRSTLRREVREGRLRIAKRAGRYFLLGRWILEWVEGGEVRRPPSHQCNGAAGGGAGPTRERGAR
jgi:hypothetical protein